MSNDNKLLFSVCYDIERPWNKIWNEIRQKPKEELTQEEKQEIDKRKYWDKEIGNFIEELEQLGFRINWSVFLIPHENYEKTKNLVDRYTRKFTDMGIGNDIYILKYHPDSNETLLDKAKLHMKMRIEKLVKRMSKEQDDGNTNEIKYLRREAEGIIELSSVFDKELPKDLLKYCNDLIDKHGIRASLNVSGVSLRDFVDENNSEEDSDVLYCDCGKKLKVNPPDDNYVKCGCGRAYVYKARSNKYVRAKLGTN